ncbi:hypothetical protein [Mycolicibacterium austroafricanum]|uniref:hypothetical protein n=1 Tax=Mycolicibacterium austroafricanum TaxID=39687 RepID=UPI000563BF38|nr:hypothetical protein [Mycolicibacterium austroafricanum]
MSMNLNLNASTDGYDDAEALAAALESVAAKIRTAGGDPVHADGDITVSASGENQSVFLSFVAR